jgi:hypothetical protein
MVASDLSSTETPQPKALENPVSNVLCWDAALDNPRRADTLPLYLVTFIASESETITSESGPLLSLSLSAEDNSSAEERLPYTGDWGEDSRGDLPASELD